jgi:MFS transporter, DHA3 family, macrolide efflux protein
VTPFQRLWLAQSVSLLGDFVAVFGVQVAVTFRMHGTPRDLAGVFIAGLIPGMALGPLAGAFADRWDPRRVMLASDAVRGALVLALPWARGLHELYAISFAISCVSSFFGPAHAISVPLLVPRERLFAAVAHMQQTMQLVRIASPAVAGALVSWWGERWCYYADAASFAFSAALLATLRYERHAPAHRGNTVWGETAAGLQFLIRDSRFISVILSMTAGTFAAGCFAALASVYVRDVLRQAPAVLAMMSSLIAAGTVGGSFVLARYWQSRDPHVLIAGGMAGVGASILLFAAHPGVPASAAGSLAMGGGVATVMVAATALLQGATPCGLRGCSSLPRGTLSRGAYSWAKSTAPLPVTARRK